MPAFFTKDTALNTDFPPPSLPTNFTSCIAFHRNIVATVNLNCRLDLKTIALHARNAEYNPKVSYRAMSEQCADTIFFLSFCSSSHSPPF